MWRTCEKLPSFFDSLITKGREYDRQMFSFAGSKQKGLKNCNYCKKIKAINQGHNWDFVIVVLANLPHFHFLPLRTDRTLESHESLECLVCLVCQVCQCLSWKTYTCCKKQNLKSETKLHKLHAIYWTTLLPWDWKTKLWWMQTACEDRRHKDSTDAWGNVATITVRVVLIPRSERWILRLFLL